MNRLNKLKSFVAEDVSTQPTTKWEEAMNGSIYMLKNTGIELNTWLSKNKKELDAKLHDKGAVLCKGFGVGSVEKFEELTREFQKESLEYTFRSSPRFSIGENVYVSTTYPKKYKINMHSESSYAPEYPDNIVFCCSIPADKGGETPIADNRKVLGFLSDSTRAKFEKLGVKYVRNLHPEIGLSWEEVFQTKDKSVVEEECRRTNIDFYWLDNGGLRIEWCKKAIYKHPVTNQDVWFNHGFFFNKYALDPEVLQSFIALDLVPNNTYFGDGSEISENEIEELRLAYEKATVAFKWEKGDVLFLDNMLTAHGRNPFEGERKILVAIY